MDKLRLIFFAVDYLHYYVSLADRKMFSEELRNATSTVVILENNAGLPLFVNFYLYSAYDFDCIFQHFAGDTLVCSIQQIVFIEIGNDFLFQ